MTCETNLWTLVSLGRWQRCEFLGHRGRLWEGVEGLGWQDDGCMRPVVEDLGRSSVSPVCFRSGQMRHSRWR